MATITKRGSPLFTLSPSFIKILSTIPGMGLTAAPKATPELFPSLEI